MSFFEVPGWFVSGKPTTESPKHSKKRKRTADTDGEKATVGELNLEKLVKKLRGNQSENVSSSSSEKKSRSELKKGQVEEMKKFISLPKPLRPVVAEAGRRLSVHTSPLNRRKNHNHQKIRSSVESAPAQIQSPAKTKENSNGLTEMQRSMKHSLDGARFRMINETLYKSPSHEAQEMMRDSRVFEEYHMGFRHQVQSWPTNPVDHYISVLSKYPVRTMIADFGCGDAKLAKALLPLGLKVLSYDFVSDGGFVVEADICARIPLPGSEGTEGEKTNGEGHVVDVVVCSLSLMGTNWPNCLREAWRILKPNGELLIAEVASRFMSMDQFMSLVGLVGFKLRGKDESNTHFTLFEFRKIARQKFGEKEWVKVLSRASVLKGCEYKRR